jgi:hypothetical protein
MADRSQYLGQTTETQTRFDLNAAIENWRAELAAQLGLTPEVRRELETHLRDTIAAFQQRGLNDEESFWLACKRVGQPQQLAKEFRKVILPQWNKRAAFFAWTVFAISFFLPSYGDSSGYVCALLQNFYWPNAIGGKSGAIHYELLTLSNVLMLASPFALFRLCGTAQRMKWMRWLIFSSTVLVWSFVIRLLADEGGANIKIGCYIWSFSFALLYLSVLPQFIPTKNQKTPKRA